VGRDLKAENLTISVPNRGCDKNCPYCVSRMTGYVTNDYPKMKRNVTKVKEVARAAEVTSVLFTGKGEPMLAFDELVELIGLFFDWPLELQTNGIRLAQDGGRLLDTLYDAGLDVIAISLDNKGEFDAYRGLFSRIAEAGLVSRVTVNVTELLGGVSFGELLAYCHESRISQLTLRRIVTPERPKDKKTADWIARHVDDGDYRALMDQAKAYVKSHGKLIRTLNHGVEVFDCDGVSFSWSDYCIQERSAGDNVRSLIFLEDGHLYTSWNSAASILF
jgi:sulfatase maturation enzyme AslB (radical SAM superfamily)